MDISINNDQQQLIQMSTLSSPEKSQSNGSPVVMRETTILNHNHLAAKSNSFEIKQQAFFRGLFSLPAKFFQHVRYPHFSDRSLRLAFLTFIAFIGVTSFSTALIVGTTLVQFKQQCPLYATFKFESLPTSLSNWTVRMVPLSEIFSPRSTCDFCTFFNVFTFIYCVISGFFFVLFNGDHRIVASNDRYLIIPWFPISVTLGFFSLINACILTNGFLKFCSTITSYESYYSSCVQLNQIFFEQYPTVSALFTYILLAIIASWLQLAFFIGITAILTIRLGSSFDWKSDDENILDDNKPSTTTAVTPPFVEQSVIAQT